MNSSDRQSRIIRDAVDWQPMPISRLARSREMAQLDASQADAKAAAAIQARIAAAFHDGVAQGLQQAHAQTEERERLQGMNAQQRWDLLLAGLAGGISEIQSAMADRLLDLTVTLAAAIACREITLSENRIGPVLEESLKLITGTCRNLDVAANPSDCAAIDSWLRPRCADVTTLSIRPDPTIAPGGCRLRADDTTLDATLQTRIRRTLAAVGIEPRQADAVAAQAVADGEAASPGVTRLPGPAIDGSVA